MYLLRWDQTASERILEKRWVSSDALQNELVDNSDRPFLRAWTTAKRVRSFSVASPSVSLSLSLSLSLS